MFCQCHSMDRRIYHLSLYRVGSSYFSIFIIFLLFPLFPLFNPTGKDLFVTPVGPSKLAWLVPARSTEPNSTSRAQSLPNSSPRPSLLLAPSLSRLSGGDLHQIRQRRKDAHWPARHRPQRDPSWVSSSLFTCDLFLRYIFFKLNGTNDMAPP